VHMWGLQWWGVKPWLMGQPVRREDYDEHSLYRRGSMVERVTAAMSPMRPLRTITTTPTSRVTWTSPFFIKCKFGVLQYVLIKALCAVATALLEWKGWYREGQFHYAAGYTYICFITNLSQCWALYCLIFFYYATKTELSPIRPVGKFLSVKALVFFTWWQAVFVTSLCQMQVIPAYKLADRDMSPEDVAKGIQDYLICIEMFAAAIAHSVVFPHSEYSIAAVRARANAIHQRSPGHSKATAKRLGRRRVQNSNSQHLMDDIKSLHIPDITGVELITLEDHSTDEGSAGTWDEPSFDRASHDADEDAILHQRQEENNGAANGTDLDNYHDEATSRPGFFHAFLDSAIPRDLRDNTMHIMRGDFHVEKKTLLHHAATSDQYELFSARRAYAAKRQQSIGAAPRKSKSDTEDQDKYGP
jgi:Organic solute transporter Ostalpha